MGDIDQPPNHNKTQQSRVHDLWDVLYLKTMKKRDKYGSNFHE